MLSGLTRQIPRLSWWCDVSAAAAWSYTSTATHWARLSRDDWTGVQAWAAPVTFACDYKDVNEQNKQLVSFGSGIEIALRQQLYTERSTIKQGDMVLIGSHTAADPVATGAFEVRAVTRFADTFDNAADDYMVAT